MGALAGAGPIALAVVGTVGALKLMKDAVDAVIDSLNKQVEELSAYSEEVAEATAMSSLRKEMAMMDRAERIGPDLAKYEDIRSRIEQRKMQMETDVYSMWTKFIADLEPVIQIGLNFADLGIAVMNDLFEFMGFVRDLLFNWEDLPSDLKDMKEAASRTQKAIQGLFDLHKDEQLNHVDPILDGLLGQFEKVKAKFNLPVAPKPGAAPGA